MKRKIGQSIKLGEAIMTFEEMIPEIEKSGINLYGMAFYRDGEIQEHRFQPASNCHNCYSVAKAFTMTAIGMTVLKIFGRMGDGTFVFMVDGLQLIIAAALVALAILVVYHAVVKLSAKDAPKA